MRAAWAIALCTACGRIGFDPSGEAGGNSGERDDSGVSTAGDPDARGDAQLPMIGCADVNLGSMLGTNVSTGTTAGKGNDLSGCSGDGDDLTFGWFAPATATYRIDTCASASNLDTVLYVRNGSCTGTQLACDDDSCGGGIGIQSRVAVNLTAGQGIVIVVDELFPTGGGNYQLAITQM